MRFAILPSPEAIEDLRRLEPDVRASSATRAYASESKPDQTLARSGETTVPAAGGQHPGLLRRHRQSRYWPSSRSQALPIGSKKWERTH